LYVTAVTLGTRNLTIFSFGVLLQPCCGAHRSTYPQNNEGMAVDNQVFKFFGHGLQFKWDFRVWSREAALKFHANRSVPFRSGAVKPSLEVKTTVFLFILYRIPEASKIFITFHQVWLL